MAPAPAPRLGAFKPSYNSAMTSRVDVCVRGGGIVGMALALQLASQRLRVGLVQRAESRPGDVRAYALNTASRQLLSALRVWPGETEATPVHQIQVSGDTDGQLAFDRQAVGQEALAWIVDVPALEKQLQQAVSYQSLIELCPNEESAARAQAQAGLTVVCEGRDSVARHLLGVHFTSQPYGQCAVAARLSTALPHGQTARQWFAGGEVLALLPMNGPQLALVWSVAPDKAQALVQQSTDEFQQALTQATGGALGELTLASARASWPLSLGQARRWVGPGWALAGDAAHNIHPLAGQGLNVGLADVAELARVLQSRQGSDYWRPLGDLRLLRRYERARKAEVAAMVGLTDGLQRLFSQDHPSWRLARNTGMNAVARSGPLTRWITRQAMGL